jgi:hypothetical protein
MLSYRYELLLALGRIRGRYLMPRKGHGGALAQEGPRGLAASQNMIRRAIEEKGRIGPSEQFDQISPNVLLVLIHDAIGHLVAPVHRLPTIVPILQEIARLLNDQQFLLKKVLVRDQELGFARGKLANERPKSVELSKSFGEVFDSRRKN